MIRFLHWTEMPRSRKYIVALLLHAVLALSSTDIQSSTVQPFRPATPEARAAFAQHATKDGIHVSRRAPVELSAEVSSQRPHGALNDRIAPDLKSLSEAEIRLHVPVHFLAFYTVKTRILPNVCREEGVDLQAYSYAFQLKHAAMFDRADGLMRASNLSATQLIADVYERRTESEAKVRRRLLELASWLQKTTVADGCAYLAAHVVDGASMASFGEEFPEVAGALMSLPVVPETRAGSAPPAQQVTNGGIRREGNAVVTSSVAPASDVPVDTVTDRIAADLKSLSKADAKRYAASQFLAFYNIRIGIDADVCQEEGVDLAAYVRAFKLAYGVEFARADLLTTGTRFSNAQVLTDLDSERERGVAVSRRVFLTLAGRLGETTIAAGCQYLADHAADGLAIQSFSEQFPELYAIFMSDDGPNERPGSLPASNPYLGKPINRRREAHDESKGTSQ
ncbi:hypothetical protein Y883_06270 [Luteibacter rhizovicinus DSM 16549]|nr:hypothetical protein Y883_06270 [Luteibacter rhizovicinus DSM 16549]